MTTNATTKNILAESLKALAKFKPANKITIRELTKNCNLTPPPFYCTLEKNLRRRKFNQSLDKMTVAQYIARRFFLSGFKLYSAAYEIISLLKNFRLRFRARNRI